LTNPKKEYADRGPIAEGEIEAMLKKTGGIERMYFRFRVRALIGLLKKFGKRRREFSTLRMKDLEVREKESVQGQHLFVTFTIAKKHKKGLFQYLKELKKTGNPELLNRPHPELVADWKTWQETGEGHKFKEVKTTKTVDVRDKYCKLILEYVEFVKANYPGSVFLFPSGRNVFGKSYVVFNDAHLSGSQLLRLIKQLNPQVWLHLFRELKGKEISEKLGRTLASVSAVQDFLDLERPETAMHYVKRFAPSEAEAEY